ncbi:MAG: phenylalanine--tRNA ligase subunit alpha [Candidatus Aenigmatarchaeota archaeon]
MYVLTKEGKDYLDNGLPEKRLLHVLRAGKKAVSGLNPIAVGWAKKNGWIRIEAGYAELTQEGREMVGRKTNMEIALEDVSKGEKVDQKIISVLLSRKLVQEEGAEAEEVSEITQLTPSMIAGGKWKGVPFRPYDIKAPAPEVWPGKKHFFTQAIEHIRKVWLEMGFTEMSGPMVETAFWNFDALYQPQDHPARDMADTFYMKNPRTGKIPAAIASRVKEMHESGDDIDSTGWQYKWSSEVAKQLCLRTHSTSLSARTLASLKPEDLPAKFFSIGKVFRNEVLDWKHLFEFFQTDGIVVDENVNFRHLLGYLRRFLDKMGYKKVRFRPSYFPYTEPSVEMEVYIPEKKSWMELGGAGMFRPEVVKPLLGKEIPVLAWGPGLERLIMEAYALKDIRDVYSNNLAILRRTRMW